MKSENVGKRTMPNAEGEEVTKNNPQTAQRSGSPPSQHCLANEYEWAALRKRRPVTEKERKEAISAARLFKTTNPSFMVIMKPSYLRKGLNVPLVFARKHFTDGAHSVKLRLPNGRTWCVRFFLCSNIKALLSGGWNAFARENVLLEGDCCVFEVLKKKEIEMKVSIFRVVDDWVPLVGSVGKVNIDLGPLRKKKGIVITEGETEPPKKSKSDSQETSQKGKAVRSSLRLKASAALAQRPSPKKRKFLPPSSSSRSEHGKSKVEEIHDLTGDLSEGDMKTAAEPNPLQSGLPVFASKEKYIPDWSVTSDDCGTFDPKVARQLIQGIRLPRDKNYIAGNSLKDLFNEIFTGVCSFLNPLVDMSTRVESLEDELAEAIQKYEGSVQETTRLALNLKLTEDALLRERSKAKEGIEKAEEALLKVGVLEKEKLEWEEEKKKLVDEKNSLDKEFVDQITHAVDEFKRSPDLVNMIYKAKEFAPVRTEISRATFKQTFRELRDFVRATIPNFDFSAYAEDLASSDTEGEDIAVPTGYVAVPTEMIVDTEGESAAVLSLLVVEQQEVQRSPISGSARTIASTPLNNAQPESPKS
ncbi:hypothetical protein NE237_022282 [Protea cynaroides]|uniref:TF-B3 domain-containing protein n=1 Tax=Protea cynaroides TaxID=273540 RepID=A0A9Q0K5N8_9MAGN|nr:hypothetical protein NE237_022282 [Protea cynaroides]